MNNQTQILMQCHETVARLSPSWRRLTQPVPTIVAHSNFFFFFFSYFSSLLSPCLLLLLLLLLFFFTRSLPFLFI
jgi:hypothetical protein